MGSINKRLAKKVRANQRLTEKAGRHPDNFAEHLAFLQQVSQAEFDLAFLPHELDEIYQYALSLLDAGRDQAALTLLTRIAESNRDISCKTGALAHLSLHYLDKFAASSSVEDINLAKMFLSRSVAHDSINPLAAAVKSYYDFLAGDYTASADALLRIKDPGLQEFILGKTFANLERGLGFAFLSEIQDNEKKIAAFERIVSWAKDAKKDCHGSAGLILGELYTYTGAFLQAYQIYTSLSATFKREPLLLAKLGDTCWHMDRIAEAEAYYRQSVNTCENLLNTGAELDKPVVQSFKETLRLARINLAMVSCEQGKEIDEAIVVLQQELSANSPANPIYHNLAMCYYWKQDYQKSQQYCRKALATGEDETTLILTAKNYYAQKQPDKAIEWFGKALSFIEAEQPIFRIRGLDKHDSVSFARPEWIDHKRRDIYISVIHCYLDTGDFVSAKDWHRRASELWPRDASVANLATVINSLAIADEQALKSLKESELLQERLTSSRRISLIAKRVAAKMVKLQKPERNFEPETEEDWGLVETVLHDMAVSLKADATPDESKLVPVIKRELAEAFPAADPLTIEFLTTGEFLYRIHQESQIEYSPVLMEYCKALENQLSVFLSEKGLLQQNYKYTFGDLLFIFKKSEPGNAISESLDLILRYRNMAAHNKKITAETVKEIRDGLINKRWLATLIS